MKKQMIILSILFLIFSCQDPVFMDFPYKENIIIITTLTNKTEQIKVFIRKTSPVSSKKISDDEEFNQKKRDSKILRGAKIRIFGGDDTKNKTLITDTFTIGKIKVHYKGEEYEQEQYISKKITPVKAGRYYWLEVEYKGKTYLTKPQWMQKELKNIKTDKNYKKGAKRFFRIFFDDNPEEVNFYTTKFDTTSVTDEGEEREIYDGATLSTVSDALFNGKKQVYLIFDGSDDQIVNLGTDLNDKPLYVEDAGKDPDDATQKVYYHFFLENMNYATYKFIKLERKQDQMIGSPAYQTIPANLIGNIYEKESNLPAIGNFNVMSVTRIKEDAKDL